MSRRPQRVLRASFGGPLGTPGCFATARHVSRGLPDGVRVDGVGGTRRIADTSAMHWRRRRRVGDVGVEKRGLHIEPN
eukprot:3589843-Pyramimonas_sp.AAC.1